MKIYEHTSLTNPSRNSSNTFKESTTWMFTYLFSIRWFFLMCLSILFFIQVAAGWIFVCCLPARWYPSGCNRKDFSKSGKFCVFFISFIMLFQICFLVCLDEKSLMREFIKMVMFSRMKFHFSLTCFKTKLLQDLVLAVQEQDYGGEILKDHNGLVNK